MPKNVSNLIACKHNFKPYLPIYFYSHSVSYVLAFLLVKTLHFWAHSNIGAQWKGFDSLITKMYDALYELVKNKSLLFGNLFSDVLFFSCVVYKFRKVRRNPV